MIHIKGINHYKRYSYRLTPGTPSLHNGHYSWSVHGDSHIESSPEASDFIEIGKAIHLADRAIRRSGGAASKYRNFEVTVPVHRTRRWKSQTDLLESLAEFATGDSWHIHFKPNTAKLTSVPKQNSADASTVALFSGGLDSLCGAAFLAKSGVSPLFVSHSPPGCESNKAFIDELYGAFGHQALNKERFISFRLEIRQRDAKGEHSMFQEMSRRSRPFFFLSLATAVAIAKGIRTIQMSENGALALSLPNRFDTHGPSIARQAHSKIMEGFSHLVREICGPREVRNFVNPFASMTKGDICGFLGPAKFLARRSVSCEYVGHQKADLLRWQADHPAAAKKRKMGHGPQCGLCYPCLVRRAALWKAGIDDPTEDYFSDAAHVLRQSRKRGSALKFFSGRITPPLLNSLASNPIYHERFSKNLIDMSVERFSWQYLPQLRSVMLPPGVKESVSLWSYNLMQRFANEQLEFLNDAAP